MHEWMIVQAGSSILMMLASIIIIYRVSDKRNKNALIYESNLKELQLITTRIEERLREELKLSREETTTVAKDNRSELNNAIRDFRTDVLKANSSVNIEVETCRRELIRTLSEGFEKLVLTIEDNNRKNREAGTSNFKEFVFDQRLNAEQLYNFLKEFGDKTIEQILKIEEQIQERISSACTQSKEDALLLRQSINTSFGTFGSSFEKQMNVLNILQKEKFEQMDSKQKELIKHSELKLEVIRSTVEEKLEKTLSDRLGQSFDTVGKQLIEVQKGLGEMQVLAQDVGGLKKVLTNVKMRGGFGEVQLQMLLESILAPEQFDSDVTTKKGCKEKVEFAVKFPNKDGERDFVWLPIDAKFPKEPYERLQNAYDSGDQQLIGKAKKELEDAIKKMSKDICNKYIDVPNTTNFALLFLPFEGLFAEVVRNADLLEQIRRDFKVVITGPTTLAVILNSFQMGFKTVAIQKRSSEVWKTLSGVKREFLKFGALLGKAQTNIQTGLSQLDKVVSVRTRLLLKELEDVAACDEGIDSNKSAVSNDSKF